MAVQTATVLSWGANSYGQLGQGHRNDVLEPRTITPPPKINFITGGGGHTLALSEDGTLLSCGSNEKGQTGQGQKDLSTLTPVANLESNKIVKAVGGWDFSLALTANGTLYSWGSNAFGQLGRSTEIKHSHTPMPVTFSHGEQIVDISAGLRHAVAISATGRIFTWGQGRKGQLGFTLDPKVSKCDTPIEAKITESIRPKQTISGSYHSAILSDSGEIFVWGDNKFGQLCLNPCTVKQQSDPHRLKADMFCGKRVTSLHSGWTHLVACTEDGAIWTWGRGDYGQLGRSCDGSHDFTPRPIENLKCVKEIVCGSEHTLAIDGSGVLWSWGWNEHGMCATGDEANVKLPHQVAALKDQKVGHIGCGAGHCFAITGYHHGTPFHYKYCDR